MGWYWHLVWRDQRHFETSSGHNTGGLAQNVIGLTLLSVMTSWASSFLSMYLFSKFSGTTLELKITY